MQPENNLNPQIQPAPQAPAADSYPAAAPQQVYAAQQNDSYAQPQAAPVVSAAPMQPTVAATEQSPISQYAEPSKSKSILPLLVKIVIGLVLLAAAFTAGYYARVSAVDGSRSNASIEAKSFITALNAGESDKAYEMTTANLKQRNPKAQFTESASVLKTDSPKFSDEFIATNGNKALFSVTEEGLQLEGKSNDKVVFSVLLVKTADGWKIDGINVQ